MCEAREGLRCIVSPIEPGVTVGGSSAGRAHRRRLLAHVAAELSMLSTPLQPYASSTTF